MGNETLQWLLTGKAVFVALWFASFFLLERLAPSSPWKGRDKASGFSQRQHLLQNGSFWAINAVLSPLVVVWITVLAAEIGPQWRPAWLMGGAGMVLDVLVLDLWIYLWHRANHRLPVLWRFHQVHHLDQQLDATSAFRFHFGEVFLSALARAPVILILAIPLHSVIAFETLVALTAIFHHSNIRLPKAVDLWLSRFVITPGVHWVHHHNIRRDTDSNYGTILSVWDRLFASRSSTLRTPAMALGVEGYVENRMLTLWIVPFRLKPRA